MNVLVTGGAGFIGSHFVRALRQEKKDRIIVVDRLTYAGDLRRIKDVKNVDFIKLDICDYKRLKNVFAKKKIGALVNFAAQTHVDRSIVDDSPFVDTNIKGTHNILRLVLEHKIKRLYHLSTDEVYGDIEEKQKSRRFKEGSNLFPNSPYAASKAAGDLLIRSYVRTYSMPAVIIRPSNNYGPWQHAEKFIPTVICSALKDKRVPIYARGKNRREWLYVEDCAEAILRIVCASRVKHLVYNLGSGIRPRNIEVARKILKILGKPASLIKYVKDRPGHDFMYALSSARLKDEFSWKQRVSFQKGLENTVRWYAQNRNWWSSLK